tara:strand:- start:3509 stop:5107 length:1599 start_codon:yes stop_codon:yes gene_type:complete
MAKSKKSFTKASISEKVTGEVGATVWDLSVPENTVVNVVSNFDFAPWYHKGIDEVVAACQLQIHHLKSTRDNDYSIKTLNSFCYNGINHFLDFLLVYNAATEKDIHLSDISKHLIEQFIAYLNQSDASDTTQYNRYTHCRMLLRTLINRGIIKDSTIFPRNPFSSKGNKHKSHKALSSKERSQLIYALKHEINHYLQSAALEPSGYFLTCCLLAIALRTGRNTTPLLEMSLDCLRDHPLKENRKLLVVYKRRARNTNQVSLRLPESIEAITTVLPDVVTIIESVIRKSEHLREHSDLDTSQYVWIYQSSRRKDCGALTTLNDQTICQNVKKIVEKHGLEDTDGNPLQVNVSRLRATFVNRIWKLSGNDPIITAKLGGHTPKVSNDHYLQATPEMQRDHKFLGDVMIQELMSGTLGKHADNTPVGKCRDPMNGEKAPKNGDYCTDFLGCFRCRSCVITGDDLYRLFSFYWLIIKERNEIGPRHWGKVYAHIIRIIDRQIAPQFSKEQVETERAKAKDDPHPFWRNRELLEASL